MLHFCVVDQADHTFDVVVVQINCQCTELSYGQSRTHRDRMSIVAHNSFTMRSADFPRPRQDLVLHRKLRSFQLDAMLDKSGLTLQGRPFSKPRLPLLTDASQPYS